MDCFKVNLKNVDPPFFKFKSVYIKISFTRLESQFSVIAEWGKSPEIL